MYTYIREMHSLSIVIVTIIIFIFISVFAMGIFYFGKYNDVIGSTPIAQHVSNVKSAATQTVRKIKNAMMSVNSFPTGKITIMNSKGSYLSAQNPQEYSVLRTPSDPPNLLFPNSPFLFYTKCDIVLGPTTPSAWEKFTVVPFGSQIALKTHWNSYITAMPDGSIQSMAQIPNVWEKFTPVYANSMWYLKTWHGTYLNTNATVLQNKNTQIVPDQGFIISN